MNDYVHLYQMLGNDGSPCPVGKVTTYVYMNEGESIRIRGRTNRTKGDKIDDRSHRAQVKLRFNLAHNYKPECITTRSRSF